LPILLRLALLAACLAARAAPVASPAAWQIAGGRVFQHTASAALGSGNTLVEDDAGYVWVGTQSGLVRWDGYRERAYAADPAEATALPDPYVRTLLVDHAHRLWVGTNGGGLARYEPTTDAFVRIADPQAVAGQEIDALVARPDGSLWVGGGRGVSSFDPATGRWTHVPLPADTGAVHSVLATHDGALWIGTERGLWRRAPGADFVEIELPTRERAPVVIGQLLQDSAGRVWIGTRLHGAYVVESGAATARAVREDGRNDLASDTVRALIEARAGEVWIGTYGSGIVRVDTATWHTARERHDLNRPSSLLDDAVGAMLAARNGLVWIVTSYGLSRYDPRFDAVDTLYGGPGRALQSASVPAVLVLPDGRVWLGNGSDGIEIVDPVRGTQTVVHADPEHLEVALPRTKVLALATGPDGRVWIGTQGGLYCASADGGGMHRVPIEGRSPTSEVWAVKFTGTTLWIGGLDGLWSIETGGAAAPRLLRHFKAELGDNPRVSTLAAGTGDVLWIGTNNGVAALDRASGRVHVLRNDPKDPTALPGGMVSSLLSDARGRLWVGTFGLGLQVQTGRRADGDPMFTRLTTKEGLPHNGVDVLLPDQDGHVWASTDDGLARIDAKTLNVRPLRAAQGVGITVYWTGSGAAMPAGELLFGGEGGLIVVHPKRLLEQDPLPTPVVTDVVAGGHAVPPARLSGPQPLHVPADARSLQVEFASLAYSRQDALRYAYRLEGFDADWIETPVQRRLATYTNLPPGRYTLALRAAPERGEWAAPLRIALQVEPPWYEHPMVRAAEALAALAALFGLVKWRTAVLRSRQARLESLVAERTAELARRTEELRASQQQLEQLAYFDGLTGLANRRLFAEELRRLVAETQRGGAGFALALVDLDRFKQINDAFGHDAGDTVLMTTGQRLTTAVRAGDRVARLGGDEFALLLHPVGDDAASIDAVYRRITELLAEPMRVPSGDSVRAGASVGIARCPQDADSAEALYKAADVALYEAKRAGRGQWRRAGSAARVEF
jgi:diguanylate cyclase (GGDEF)-like protein